MSIRILTDGADGFALLSPQGELVGWIRGRAIGVAGFRDESAAIDAAVRANPVLSEWLERNGLPPLVEFGGSKPQIVHDGAHRWILVERVPVARLPEPAPTLGDDTIAHSFEIVVRGAISDGMAIHAALIALRAARGDIDARHIRWPLERIEALSGPTRRAS